MKSFRINPDNGMEVGIFTLGEHVSDPLTGKIISEQQRISEIITTAEMADQAGLDVFGLGESHQAKFISSANQVILGAIAQATKNIKITSSATVLSTADPVRVYEEYATLDLISGGRAELVAGRASRVGAFELLGFNLRDYEELFEEKMELLIQLNEEEKINWSGQFRAPLNQAEIFPQPLNDKKLPIWRAVGGGPASAIKAARQGVPMMLSTLGGPAYAFSHAVKAYRQTLAVSGFDPLEFPIGTTSLMHITENSQDALREFYPYANHIMEELRGTGYAKSQFAESIDTKSAMLLGSPQQLIEKILYQHELYGHQRVLGQVDIGGMPLSKIEKTIDLLANIVAPAVKKATKMEVNKK
ncbi:LLM class flavin-dependent oxidoreductase [Listeria weihenstephanensis]|uniref:LLM class flavin-dependent oxidoreductase n=1 Tax=Listeria weihenstephanensis TaxID=1006155 RepID=A0A841Z421_9LIST|nr:LLM class flavin-dependent oxidoreductase [Listeria weihenstephanensis]MBC1500671.1 LLM class flavin-dependent oxidoreductase [Listeria weihenstephanensis]